MPLMRQLDLKTYNQPTENSIVKVSIIIQILLLICGHRNTSWYIHPYLSKGIILWHDEMHSGTDRFLEKLSEKFFHIDILF